MATTTTTTHRTRRSPATLSAAAFFVFVATLFFWLSAFSTPFIKHIYYLRTGPQDFGVHYGTFGWCAYDNDVCDRSVGYSRSAFPGHDHLTGSLILVAITAGFGSLAFFSLLHSISDLRSGFCSFFLTLLTALLSTISFLLVVVCFGVAHHRFKDLSLGPHYGPALPLVIVGWLLYLVAIPLVLIGWFRERHYRHEMTTTTTTTRRKWF